MLKAGIVHPVHLRVVCAHKELIPSTPEGDGRNFPRKLGATNLLEAWGSGGLQDMTLSRAQQEVPRGEELDAAHPLSKFLLWRAILSDQGSCDANL